MAPQQPTAKKGARDIFFLPESARILTVCFPNPGINSRRYDENYP